MEKATVQVFEVSAQRVFVLALAGLFVLASFQVFLAAQALSLASGQNTAPVSPQGSLTAPAAPPPSSTAPAAGGGSGASVPENLQNLPDMVGGC